MNDECLTDEQCKLVEKNHNLIYGFANKKNLIIDEYYDILAIGLCKAAKGYKHGKGRFSTYAYTCMNNELNTYWRGLQKKTAIPKDATLSYDVQSDDDSNGFMNSLIECSTYDETICNIALDELINRLDSNEKFVIKSLINGCTQKEISDKMNCTSQNISLYTKRLRNKVIDVLFNK